LELDLELGASLVFGASAGASTLQCFERFNGLTT